MIVVYAYLSGSIIALALVLLGNNPRFGFWIYVAILALAIMVHAAFKLGEDWAKKKTELDRKP